MQLDYVTTLKENFTYVLTLFSKMFTHHLYLEMRGLNALVVAVRTDKRLITSYRDFIQDINYI